MDNHDNDDHASVSDASSWRNNIATNMKADYDAYLAQRNADRAEIANTVGQLNLAPPTAVEQLPYQFYTHEV